MTKIHNKFKVVFLLVTILLTVFSMFHIFTSYQHDVPIAKNGTISISSKDLKKGFVALNGDFLVYDGLYDVNQINSLNIPAKHMSLEDIRVYPFPKGTATVKMTIKSNVKLSGMIIEEIYTANEVYLNNKLICKSGIVGSKDQAISEKASHLKNFKENVSSISYVFHSIGVFDTKIAHIVFPLSFSLSIIHASHLSNLRVSYW